MQAKYYNGSIHKKSANFAIFWPHQRSIFLPLNTLRSHLEYYRRHDRSRFITKYYPKIEEFALLISCLLLYVFFSWKANIIKIQIRWWICSAIGGDFSLVVRALEIDMSAFRIVCIRTKNVRVNCIAASVGRLSAHWISCVHCEAQIPHESVIGRLMDSSFL